MKYCPECHKLYKDGYTNKDCIEFCNLYCARVQTIKYVQWKLKNEYAVNRILTQIFKRTYENKPE